MNWETQYGYGVELKKPLIGEFYFKFPNRDGVHQIVKPVGGISSKAMSMTFVIKPPGTLFNSVDGDTAKVRFFIQREGDDMSGEGEYQFYRYWSNPGACLLRPGRQTLSVSLKPDQWSDVKGKYAFMNPLAFRATLQKAEWVGLAFGGHFFSHGAWAVGSAKFRLVRFSP